MSWRGAETHARRLRAPLAGLAAASRRLILAVVALMLAAPLAAQEQKGFFLELDTGGHRALVKGVAFTPDGELLLSASDDKTIRVWDWKGGATIRTIRGEIGPGQEGKIFAIAISPDGKSVAAAGWFGPSAGDRPPYGDVRVFDIRSGALTAVLSGPDYVVFDLAFSPDGSRLAAGGQDGFVFIWRREGEAWVPETRLDADSNRIEKIAFAAGGTRLAATTADNGIRLWRTDDMSEIALDEAEPLRDVPVRALAVSGDGSLLATGADDGQVQLWRAGDGALVTALPQHEFLVGALAFAGGDANLVVSCGYRCADRHGQRVVAIAEAADVHHYRGHDGTVVASAATPDGLLVATAGGERHEIHVWNPATGEVAALLGGAGSPVNAVGIAPDGAEIAWGNADACPQAIACPEVIGVLEHTMLLPVDGRFFERPRAADGDLDRFARAVQREDGTQLAARAGGDADLPNAILEVERDGSVAASIENDATSGFLHAAFTLLGGDVGLVTGGSDGTLIEYDLKGEFRGEFRDGHTGQVNAVAEARGAKLLLTGSADQTLRLWNLATRKLVVSMFFAGEERIIWVPQGYYYSSPGGDRFVGWHLNQGRSREARFVKARQLKQYLFSPEIVRRAIMLADAEAAVRELRGDDKELDRLLERRPPEFAVRVVEDGAAPREGFVTIEITGAGAAETAVEDFSIVANDRRVDSFATRAVGGDGDRITVEVPVAAGQNEITVSGLNEYGYLTERSVKAIGRIDASVERAGKLYVVAIGVEDYPLLPTQCGGRSCDLSYPVDDAAEFVRLIAERSAPLYGDMKALVFLNREALEEDPARAAALAGVPGLGPVMEPEGDAILDEIEDFLGQAQAEDTTIVFVAGHGINIDEDYFFIPTDGRAREGDRWQRSSLVGWETIQKAVERAKGRRLMLIDTCHAANAFNPRLEKDSEDARIIVFSATAANNTAAELPELGHGVFTYSLLAGIRGGADPTGDGVRLLALADYVDREVRRLTASRQVPEYYISKVDNFVVARP